MIRTTQNVFHLAYRRFLTFVHVERVRTLQVPFVSDRLFQKRCHFCGGYSFSYYETTLEFQNYFSDYYVYKSSIILFTNLN